MARINDVVVIILDVGKNSSEVSKINGKKFYDQAKECVENILQRKIFTRPKDEVGLLLLGTNETDNEMNKDCGGYKNISWAFPISPVSWDSLRFVAKSLPAPNNDDVIADWLDGIVVAVDQLKRSETKKCLLKIILLSTYTRLVDVSNIDAISRGMDDLQINLLMIGEDIVHKINDSQRKIDSDEIVEFEDANVKLVKKIADRLNGAMYTFDQILHRLCYLDKQMKRRVAWNCDLEIGSKLKIKIAAYIYVRKEKQLSSWKIGQPENGNGQTSSVANVAVCTQAVTLPNTADGTIRTTQHAPEDLINAYKYDGEWIPMEFEKPFQSGGKQLRVIGFTHQSHIDDYNTSGSTIHLVVAQKRSLVDAQLITALVQVMRRRKLVMMARYVYGSRGDPKVMALFPNEHCSDFPEHGSLMMYELFYNDQYNEIQFPPLRQSRNQPSKEQYAAIDKHIDAFDLTKLNGGTSTKPFQCLIDPSLQHNYRALKNRALNPSEPLLPMDKDLADMLKAPAEAMEKAQPIIEEIKTLFKLQEKVTKKRGLLYKKFEQQCTSNFTNAADGEGANGDESGYESMNDRMEAFNPAKSVSELIKSGNAFESLVEDLREILHEITFKVLEPKVDIIKETVKVYRDEAKKGNPDLFNEWIMTFKKDVECRQKTDLWNIAVLEERLGLITLEENAASEVDVKRAQKFYELEAQEIRPNVTRGQTMNYKELEGDDLFDL